MPKRIEKVIVQPYKLHKPDPSPPDKNYICGKCGAIIGQRRKGKITGFARLCKCGMKIAGF